MQRYFELSTISNDDVFQHGFTIIEVLAAMALFMLGILSLTGLQMACIRGNAAARIQTEATAIAVQRIEQLQMLPQDHTDLDVKGNPHELKTNQHCCYRVRWEVMEMGAHPSPKIVRVTVVPENPFNGKSVTLSTILVR